MEWSFKKPPLLEGNVNRLIEKVGEWVLVVHRDVRFPCISCLEKGSASICTTCFGTDYKSSLHITKARISYDGEEGGTRVSAGYVDRENPSIHFPREFRPTPLDLVYKAVFSNTSTGDPRHILMIEAGYRITGVIDRHNGSSGWWHIETQALNQDFSKMLAVVQTQAPTLHKIDTLWLKF